MRNNLSPGRCEINSLIVLDTANDNSAYQVIAKACALIIVLMKVLGGELSQYM